MKKFSISPLLFILFSFIFFSSISLAQTPCENIDHKKEVKTAKEHTEKREYDQANTIYDNLIACLNKQNKTSEALELEIMKAANWQSANELTKSKKLIDKIILEIEGKNNIGLDTILALAYHKKGVGYYNIDDFAKAVLWLIKAIDIRLDLFGENHPDIIKGYHNVGNCYFGLKKYEEAGKWLHKSLDLHLSADSINKTLIATTNRVLGNTYVKKGDVKEAENYLLHALDNYKILYKEQPWDLAPIYNDFVLLFREHNQPAKMLAYAREGLNVYKSFDDKYAEDYWGMAGSYFNIGQALEILGDLEEAIDNYKSALEIYSRYPEKRKAEIAATHHNLSIVFRKNKDFGAALKAIDRSIDMYQELDEASSVASSFHNKAEMYYDSGDFIAALDLQHRAVQQVVFGFDKKDVYQNPAINDAIINDPINLLKYLHGKAQALLQLASGKSFEKNAKAAIATYDTLFLLADQMRWELKADASKTSMLEELRPAFEEAIELSWEFYNKTNDQYWQDKIFLLMEKSKSLVLFEALIRSKAKLSSGISEDLQEREKALRQKMARTESEIFRSDHNIEKLRKKLVEEKQAYKNLMDSIKTISPEFIKSIYPDDRYGISDFRAKLLNSDYTALIEYFIGTKNIYIAVLDLKKTSIYKVTNNFGLGDLVKQLHRSFYEEQLSVNPSNESYIANADELINAAYLLYSKIFQPFEKNLKPYEKLIIVPDGILAYIPFDVLVKNKSSDNTLYKSHLYLIKDYQISYAYSAAWLCQIKQRNFQKAKKYFLGFAPDFLPVSPTIEMNDRRSGFAPLEHNKKEVESIDGFFGGEVFFDHEATKSNFKEIASNYRILHLATHGKANDQYGDYSYLAFTNINTNKEDFLLYAREIYELQLGAEMVVLSACETGLGELQKGEGMISLSRGFAYAGARSVITTLWSVNDHTTAQLMGHFYAYLEKGKNKDEALRQAKIDYLENAPHDEAHPFFWAGFIPVGEMSPISSESTFLRWGILLFALAGFFLFLKRKK